ncbi:MAG: tRNA (guanosine(46)-N7)-methyltransferase TrmB [Chloroflexi bacterium]|nr:tRNA (guanosine(46)-N7)-methyltransferase TrmB [Chloroflexota bacterium]
MQKLNSLMLPWPTDWTALFGAERALIVEIGFGHGDFLLDLARKSPDANVIGLEIANRSLLRAERKIEQAGLRNVCVIHSMAETALAHLFVPASIQQIHINFPDPWFKQDHSHRRLMQRDTLDTMVSRLAADGELYLATDILAYAEMAHDLLANTPGLDNQQAVAWVTEMPGRIISKYEAAARREGRTCYFLTYRRNHQPAPYIPVFKELAMPHIVFASPLTLNEIAERFEPLQQSADGINVHLMKSFLGRESLLIETHVGETTITQHVALLLIERPQPDTPGTTEYTIQLGTIGQPRATPGVHQAVRLLGDWALGLHPDNHVIKEKVGGSSE